MNNKPHVCINTSCIASDGDADDVVAMVLDDANNVSLHSLPRKVSSYKGVRFHRLFRDAMTRCLIASL